MNTIKPTNKYIMHDGTLILEFNDYSSLKSVIKHDYNFIKKEFPEFNPTDKNKEFIICENVQH